MKESDIKDPPTRSLALKLKNTNQISKKKKKRSKKIGHNDQDENDRIDETLNNIQIIQGSGKIVTSGCSIQGFETRFKEEVEIGDRIFIHILGNVEGESNIVTNILSNRCLSVHFPYSRNFTSMTPYTIKKESVLLKKIATQKTKLSNHDEEDEQTSTALIQDEISKLVKKKIEKSKTVAYVREKTGLWGYKLTKKEFNQNLSAEEILDLRTKQNRDKFCW